jgi:hypothetical protein
MSELYSTVKHEYETRAREWVRVCILHNLRFVL